MNFLDINSQVFFKDMVIMEALLSVNIEMRTKSAPWSLFKHLMLVPNISFSLIMSNRSAVFITLWLCDKMFDIT